MAAKTVPVFRVFKLTGAVEETGVIFTGKKRLQLVLCFHMAE